MRARFPPLACLASQGEGVAPTSVPTTACPPHTHTHLGALSVPLPGPDVGILKPLRA